MPVFSKKITFVLLLQFKPVFQHTVQVTEVEFSRRSHAAQDAFHNKNPPSIEIKILKTKDMYKSKNLRIINNIMIKKPYGSILSKRCLYFGGSSAATTLLPSRGGTGSRLKAKSVKFK